MCMFIWNIERKKYDQKYAEYKPKEKVQIFLIRITCFKKKK